MTTVDPPEPERRPSVLRAATLVSGLTLASRVAGLARDVLTTHAFGRGWVFDAFVVAWLLPNMLRRMFGEGALSAAFVPAYTRRLERDPAAARRLLAAVLGGVTALLTVVSVAVVAAMLLLPGSAFGLADVADASGAARGDVLAGLTAILFPYSVLVCALALTAGALQAHGVFGPGAIAPLLLNGFWIAGLWLGAGDPLPTTARLVAWLLLLGGAVQLLLAVVPLLRRGALAAPRLPRAGDGSREVFRAMLPTLVGMSAVQINQLVDQAIGFWLVGAGANSALFLANRLLLFPHALVALPLATAVFPTLARQASRADFAGLREQLARATALTALLALPAAVGMALVAEDLIAVAFGHGRFTAADVAETSRTTIAVVAALPGIGVAQLRARALFALGDTRSPARVALALVVVNLALSLALAVGLGLGVVGIAASTSVCAWLNAAALGAVLRRRLGGPAGVDGAALRRAVLAVAALTAAVLATRAAAQALLGAADGRWALAVQGLLLPIPVGIGAWIATQAALGAPEWRALRARLTRRRSVTRGARTP